VHDDNDKICTYVRTVGLRTCCTYRTVIRILQGSAATFLEMQLKKNPDLVVELFYISSFMLSMWMNFVGFLDAHPRPIYTDVIFSLPTTVLPHYHTGSKMSFNHSAKLAP